MLCACVNDKLNKGIVCAICCFWTKKLANFKPIKGVLIVFEKQQKWLISKLFKAFWLFWEVTKKWLIVLIIRRLSHCIFISTKYTFGFFKVRKGAERLRYPLLCWRYLCTYTDTSYIASIKNQSVFWRFVWIVCIVLTRHVLRVLIGVLGL